MPLGTSTWHGGGQPPAPTRSTTLDRLSAANAAFPVSISYMTQPSAHTSDLNEYGCSS